MKKLRRGTQLLAGALLLVAALVNLAGAAVVPLDHHSHPTAAAEWGISAEEPGSGSGHPGACVFCDLAPSHGVIPVPASAGLFGVALNVMMVPEGEAPISLAATLASARAPPRI
jgi:hypothetical protein